MDQLQQEALGCIPSRWDDRNLRYAVRAPTFTETTQIPDEYTGLSDLVKCLGGQGDIGSCTGWAGAALMKAVIYLNDSRQVLPSAGSIYWRSRNYNNPPLPDDSEGSYPISIMKLLQKDGCTTEECSPTDTVKPFELSECEEADTIAANFKIGSYHHVPTDPASIKAAIYGITYKQPYKMADGSPGKCPLYIAIPIFGGIHGSQARNTGVVPSPVPNEYIYGYHAVILIGWKNINGEPYWIMVNSWGTNKADNGIYYLPFDYPITEAWMITDDPPIPNPEPIPPPTPQPSSCKWGNAAAAMMNVVMLQSFRGRRGRFMYMNPE